MHDVATTSKTIASARRLDIFIASPRSRSDGQAPAFFRPYRLHAQCCSVFSLLTRLQICEPTLSSPVKVRRALGTGRPYDSSRKSPVVYLTNDSFQLQSLPANFQPWRIPASHPEDFSVARLDRLALGLHLGGIGLEQLQAGKRDVLALPLDLPVERAVREDIDQHLLGLGAEEEALEKPCRIRI